MLYYLTLEWYSGEGDIADMGAFLGGSTICFAAALRRRSFRRTVLHSYDRFFLTEFERARFFPDNAPPGLRTRGNFDYNLRNYLDLIVVHEGDVLGLPWDGGPIELLFVDIAKTYRVMDHILLSYFPALIPLRSLVVMQDYLHNRLPWHHVVMEKLSSYFDYVVDTDINSVVFQPTKPTPTSVLQDCQWMAISPEERIELMDRAIDKLDTEAKQAFLQEARKTLV